MMARRFGSVGAAAEEFSAPCAVLPDDREITTCCARDRWLQNSDHLLNRACQGFQFRRSYPSRNRRSAAADGQEHGTQIACCLRRDITFRDRTSSIPPQVGGRARQLANPQTNGKTLEANTLSKGRV